MSPNSARRTSLWLFLKKGLKGEELITVDEILKDNSFQVENMYVQVSTTTGTFFSP